jgi:nucleoside-diphosphate-sugar epimerase
MNILITGGTGFIGSRLALRCLERGDDVLILGQANTPAEEGNRKLLESRGAAVTLGSVTDRERVLDVLHGVDVVYHLAAAQHEANVPDQRFWDVNVTGTRNLLEASVKAHVKRFIYGSTIGVYGSPGHGPIGNESPLQPDNVYGVTKLAAEKLVASFQQEIPGVIIRISETYGPGDHRLLKLFKAIKKNVFFMIGSGRNLHHLIYIDDLIEGFFLSTMVEEAVGKTFVLAGNEPITTDEMVTTIANHLDVAVRRFRAPLLPFLMAAAILEAVLRPLGIQPPLHSRRMDFFKKSFVFSLEQPAKILGFTPRFSFHQGVAETARSYAEMGYL